MLVELRIRSYALIDDLTIRFSEGLTVLTGETGAGKSIIIGALSLLLGEKPDADMIRTGSDCAEVEGRFTLDERLIAVCAELGLETGDGELLVRRRVERAGRGGAYANDHNVTLSALQRLGERLVDLHGQHQHQLLLRPEEHLEVLDAYAGLGPTRAEFSIRFREHQTRKAELESLDRELAERTARRELTEFQLRELADARIRPGEVAELHAERDLLQTAERRFTLCRRLEALLSDDEGSAGERIGAAAKTLDELATIDPSLTAPRASLAEAGAVVDDVWRQLVRYRESVAFSPERLDEINNRLFLIEKLGRRHRIEPDALPERQERLQAELASVETDTGRREQMAASIATLGAELEAKAAALSRRRARARKELEARVRDEFAALGLARSEFICQMSAVGKEHEAQGPGRMTETGLDAVEFLFSANPGEDPRPLRKVASGGELSRIMLALKGVLAKADPVPTLVFDEVDVGIGGRIAEVVGRRLSRLSRSRQVVCISHLPQIAKFAHAHFHVGKSTRAGRTSSSVASLDRDGRIAELARMAGGEKVTRTGLDHAREMLASVAEDQDD